MMVNLKLYRSHRHAPASGEMSQTNDIFTRVLNKANKEIDH